jgi:uncharacterized protein YdaU (DUF1376 family)
MPAAWQQWFPFYVNDYLASAKVQKMPHAARSMYIHLLLRSWESADCSIPSDSQSLQELADATAEEWAQNAAFILPCFIVIKKGKLRNERLYKEWNRAKILHENKSAKMREVNRRRWHPDSVTESATDENAALSHRDVTESRRDSANGGRGLDPAASSEEIRLARQMFEELGRPADYGTYEVVAQAILGEIKTQGTIDASYSSILQASKAARDAGETINRFFYLDGKYLPSKNGHARKVYKIEQPDPARNDPNFGKRKLRDQVTDKAFEKAKAVKARGEQLDEFDEAMLKEEKEEREGANVN